ncbi:MAG: 50S ribosomal protein L15 [Chloroflexi bacterium]|nr:50S ribosomal protein L15 [Chloroflexota bacterium]
MKLSKLTAPKGSRKVARRVGRGTGSGMGKTSGKGTKGQLARSGPGLPGWFEGGQTPLHMRLPKLRGFKNRARVEFVAVNVGVLEGAAVNGAVSVATLASHGLVREGSRIKVLGDGALTKALRVEAHAASATAKAKIEAAGGTLALVGRE